MRRRTGPGGFKVRAALCWPQAESRVAGGRSRHVPRFGARTQFQRGICSCCKVRARVPVARWDAAVGEEMLCAEYRCRRQLETGLSPGTRGGFSA